MFTNKNQKASCFLKTVLISFSFLIIAFKTSAQKYFPAGLGNSNLVLWLTAADPSTVLNASSSQAANGDGVAKWLDKSGAGANAVQATSANQPVYNTNQLNGFGGIIFQNTNQYLTGASGAYQTIVSVRSMIGTGNHYQTLFASPANGDFSIRGSFAFANTYYTDGPNSNDWDYNTGATPTQWINGTQSLSGSAGNHVLVDAAASPANATYSISSTYLSRGMYANDPVYELMSFNTTLNNTQRMLVENYEASEWGLTSNLPSSAYTVFTPPAASSFNKNLVGIGATSNTDNFLTNPAGSTDGFGFSSGTTSTDFLSSAKTGFIMAAHNAQANTIINNATISGISGNVNIWNRSWQLQKTGGNTTGNVTLNFNFNDYNGTSPSALYSYGILYNATSGTFSSGTNVVVTTSTTTVSGNTVSFIVSANNLSNGYYTLAWSQFGALAIKLNNFEITRQNESSLLQWATTQQTGSGYFEVQHSADGLNFNDIGTVAVNKKSSLNTDYSFTDTKIFSGWNYYRLKMVNATDSAFYSEVKTIYFDRNNTGFKIYPTIVNDVLHISSSKAAHISLQIINAAGQIIKSQNTDLTNSISIPLNYLSSGIYFVRIVSNNTATVQKIIKQ